MLKNAIRLAGVIVVTGLMLAGCYALTDDGVGAVGIELPDTSQGGEASDQSLARIYLINGNTMLDVSGDEADGVLYKLVEIESVENEVSIGPVSSGPGYQVVLALGNMVPAGDDEVFVPGEYAWTEDPFAVLSGQAVLVELTSASTPFGYVPSVFGEDLVGIELVNTSLFTASGDEGASTVFELDPVGLSIAAQADLPTDETAISIGYGAHVDVAYPVPWINTSKGIIPYYSGALDLNFDADYLLNVDPVPPPLPPVLDSGAFIRGGDLYGWFQVDGGLGGVYDQLLVPGDTKQWLRDVDLSTFISGQPVYDLAVADGASGIEGYFASKLGAFMLPEVVLTDPEIDEVPEILDAASFFEVVIDEEKATITELALVGGTELYLGTNRGVVSIETADIDLDVIPYDNLVTESLGLVVREMKIGSDYQAILTDHLLIVRGPSDLTYNVIPFYAGIVTAPTGMFLDDLTGVVIIAGETGLATVDIDDL